MMIWTPQNHYWLLTGDETRVWSSGRGAYVPTDDPVYAEWQTSGRAATRINSEQDLTDVLAAYDLPGPLPSPPPSITKAQCLLWLRQLDKTEADIDAFIDALSEDGGTRETARIEWLYRPLFRYDNPVIIAAADAFGIPRDYLPDAFRAAALL